MQTKYEKLTKEYKELKRKIDKCPPISKMSSKELLKYHSFLSRKENLEFKISKMLKSKTKILKRYKLNNEKWLNDNSMNCRKYYKLEQKEAYIRDKNLYKLGFLSSKPIPPIVNNLKNFISMKIINPFLDNISPKISKFNEKVKKYIESTIEKSSICKCLKKFKKSVVETLPNKLTNAAITSTKHCIIGYRIISNGLNNSTRMFSRRLSTVPTIQMISYIGKQAKMQADMQVKDFRDRIRVEPQTYNNVYSISKNNNSKEIVNEYDLAL